MKYIYSLACVLLLFAALFSNQGQAQTTTDILRNESWIITGPAVGPAAVWHNFRQEHITSDVSVGVAATWDFALAQPFPSWYLLFRPGISYLHPTLFLDAAMRFRLPIPVALVGGASFDPTWERDFPEDTEIGEHQYVREMQTTGNRAFALMGLQYVTEFAFYEFQYRIQLDKGARSYYYNPDGSPPVVNGLRRYFVLSFGMTVRL